MSNELLNDKIAAFLTKINEAFQIYYKAEFPMLACPKVMVDGGGSKYIRISDFEYTEARGKWYPRSVYLFIEKSTGNILRPAGYKTPDKKNPRGNIDDADILTKISPYGVTYVKMGLCGPSLQTILDGGYKSSRA